MFDDHFTCILHRCTLSRSACEKRRSIDTRTSWSKGLEIDCDLCRNPEITAQKQPSRARLTDVKCHYCRTRRPKDEMIPMVEYGSGKWKCIKCPPGAVSKEYCRKNPILACWKCRKKFPREIMIKQVNGNNSICPKCNENVKKRKRDNNDRTGLTEWKCRSCGNSRQRAEYYVYDLLECKRCKSSRANSRNKKRNNK